jgi:DNA anti-recombination protein RmuC
METLFSLIPSTTEGIVILFLVGAAIVVLYGKFADDPSRISSLPSLFTIIGVLGTFTGIAVGLAGFDVSPGEIEKSVGVLLEGLKSAFLTSIIGIIAAIYVRWISLTTAPSEDSTDEAEKLISILEENNRLTEKIVKSISSDEEASLTTQMKLLRTDYSDKTKELVTEFRAFAEKQSENNMKALVEAIETVIGEFNVKINEQFGENFKKLNEAVGKLLEWQENYYKQIEYMVNTIEQTNVAVDESRKVISEISEKYKDTYSLTEKFESVITTLNQENEVLQKNISSFASLANNATEAFPLIENRLNDLTSGFTTSVEKSLVLISESQSNQVSATSTMMEKLRTDLSTSFEDANKNIIGIAESVTGEVKNTIQVSNKEIKTQLTDLYSGTLNQLQELQKSMADDLNKNILKIDDSLGNALTNSLNSMSSQLATLSSQFVSDYQPLTERLRDVVRIASEINTEPDQQI